MVQVSAIGLFDVIEGHNIGNVCSWHKAVLEIVTYSHRWPVRGVANPLMQKCVKSIIAGNNSIHALSKVHQPTAERYCIQRFCGIIPMITP